MSDLFSQDFQDFISLLNKHEVAYMVVGGFAVNIYGYQRSTGDVDIWVEKTGSNYKKLMKAFVDFRLPAFDMTLENFMGSQYEVFSFGRPPQAIDIITTLKGLDFDNTYPYSVEFIENNIPIKVIHKNHLRIAKTASGRFKDLDDLSALEEK